jgi:hypothetical protein
LLALVCGCAFDAAERASDAVDPFAVAPSAGAEPARVLPAASESTAGAASTERSDKPASRPTDPPGEPAPRYFDLSGLFELFWAADADVAAPVRAEEAVAADPAQPVVLASAQMPEFGPSPSAAATIEGLPADGESRQPPTAEEASLMASMWGDCCNYYSPPSLAGLALGIGVAAILANSDLDHKIQYDGQEDARFEESDEWSHVTKTLGEGYVVLPIYLSAMILDSMFRDDFRGGIVAVWGERSLRATMVGAPSMLFLQKALGASRPSEDPLNSHWSFWADDNGVSGHAFMGAIPFLTAAKMTDNPWAKVACYGGSLAVAWSRLNDNDHFPSQVAMGWWLAYLATSAVDETDLGNQRWRLVPLPVPDGVGFALEYQR